RAEVGEGTGELATDRSASNHDDTTRHVVEHQQFVAAHDWTRELEPGDGARYGSTCEHHVGATNRRRAVSTRDRHGVIRTECADTFEDRDLLRLHEAGQALDDAIDDLLLSGLCRDEVHDGRAG